MASNGREERRRRIRERGSDRMALITGQIRTFDASPSLPASATSSYSRRARTESSPSIIYQYDHAQTKAGPEGADDDSGSELLKNKASNEASEGNDFDIGRQMGPHLRKCETNTEAIRAPAFGNMTERQTRGVTQSVQRASNNPNFFSSKRINSCIIASERTRASCSLIIACLVLISYIDYPIFGTNLVSSESIIASRPLYIVLLTDITIVFARLYRQRGESSEEVQEESMVSQEDGHNWVAAVKLLERGLVVYQSIRGIFIDCSVYLVVVICGLSLV